MERRQRALHHRHVGAQPNEFTTQVGKDRFVRDQRTHPYPVDPQDRRPRTRSPVLLGDRGAFEQLAEQRSQGHVFTEGNQSPLDIRPHQPIGSVLLSRLPDPAVRCSRVDVDQHVTSRGFCRLPHPSHHIRSLCRVERQGDVQGRGHHQRRIPRRLPPRGQRTGRHDHHGSSRPGRRRDLTSAVPSYSHPK